MAKRGISLYIIITISIPFVSSVGLNFDWRLFYMSTRGRIMVLDFLWPSQCQPYDAVLTRTLPAHDSVHGAFMKFLMVRESECWCWCQTFLIVMDTTSKWNCTVNVEIRYHSRALYTLWIRKLRHQVVMSKTTSRTISLAIHSNSRKYRCKICLPKQLSPTNYITAIGSNNFFFSRIFVFNLVLRWFWKRFCVLSIVQVYNNN